MASSCMPSAGSPAEPSPGPSRAAGAAGVAAAAPRAGGGPGIDPIQWYGANATVASSSTGGAPLCDEAVLSVGRFHDELCMDLTMAAGLHAARAAMSPSDFAEAHATLLKVFGNILSDPANEKFTMLRKSNAVVSRKLSHPFCVEALLLCGFVETEDAFLCSPEADLAVMAEVAAALRAHQPPPPPAPRPGPWPDQAEIDDARQAPCSRNGAAPAIGASAALGRPEAPVAARESTARAWESSTKAPALSQRLLVAQRQREAEARTLQEVRRLRKEQCRMRTSAAGESSDGAGAAADGVVAEASAAMDAASAAAALAEATAAAAATAQATPPPLGRAPVLERADARREVVEAVLVKHALVLSRLRGEARRDKIAELVAVEVDSMQRRAAQAHNLMQGSARQGEPSGNAGCEACARLLGCPVQ